MGFLKNKKNNQSGGIHKDWKSLTSLDQLDQIIEDSNKKTVAIFKHSTRCGISTRAKFVLEDDWDIDPNDLDFYYLDLLEYRPISNKIEEVTHVQHQSPQVVVIKGGEAVYDESHHAINVSELKEFI